MKKKGLVWVGLSGGVDSSVSVYLLKKEGYDVVGVFIKTWQPDFVECTWKEERRDAMRVAAHLDIPFLTLDLQDLYKKEVVDYFINEYKAGRTPNPDILCNKEIKFGAFYEKAISSGADFVATGHYAQVVGGGQLRKSKDKDKDQTYFLWALDGDILNHVLFPVGDKKKEEVRKIAKHAGLPVFEKKDSQGICMLGDFDVKEFLAHFIEPKVGVVLDETGKIIGEHNGATFLTIGERHGFKVENKESDQESFFIIAKDVEKNTITVSHNRPTSAKSKIKLTKVNFINKNYAQKDFECRVKIRHQRIDFSAKVFRDGEGVYVESDEKDFLAVAGQSIVFYVGEECIGGGIVN